MNKTVSGEENLYFEMESVKKETEARIYDEVTGDSATSTTEQTSYEKCTQRADKKQNGSAEHENACQCDAVALRRMLIVMSVVAAVALLTAIAALILALTEMKSRNNATAEVQGIGSTSAMISEDDDRIEKVSENITTLERKMEERIQQVEKRIPNEESFRKEIDELRTLLENQTAKQSERITSQLNLTTKLLHSSDASLFALLIDVNSTITEKVNNVSKMAGPIGPPGHDGSQGPAGPAGARGLPGPKGAENFSSRQYKSKTGAAIPGFTWAATTETEPNGKMFLGVTCSTNFATEYNLKSQQRTGKWSYVHVCTCRGTSTEFRPGREAKNCYLHYWECPLTT